MPQGESHRHLWRGLSGPLWCGRGGAGAVHRTEYQEARVGRVESYAAVLGVLGTVIRKPRESTSVTKALRVVAAGVLLKLDEARNTSYSVSPNEDSAARELLRSVNSASYLRGYVARSVPLGRGWRLQARARQSVCGADYNTPGSRRSPFRGREYRSN